MSDLDARTAGQEASGARAAPGVDAGAHGASDAQANVRFRPRHDHILMGAAFGIHTDRAGSSGKAAPAQPSPTPRLQSPSLLWAITAIAALLAGAVLLTHAVLGWAPWIARVPGLASGRNVAVAGLALLAVAVAVAVWARHVRRTALQ